MTKIEPADQLERFKNMRGLMQDYKRIHNRYPTTAEFVKALSIPRRTVITYKKTIYNEDREELLELFQGGVTLDAENLINTISQNIDIYRIIRDDTSLKTEVRMTAAHSMEVGYADALRIKRDAPEFLAGTYESNSTDDTEEEEEITDEVTDNAKL